MDRLMDKGQTDAWIRILKYRLFLKGNMENVNISCYSWEQTVSKTRMEVKTTFYFTISYIFKILSCMYCVKINGNVKIILKHLLKEI